MIEVLRDMGNYAIKKEGGNINLYENPKTDYVLSINLKDDRNNVIFEKVELEEFSEEKLSKYLFKEGTGSAGTNDTPTAKVSQDIQKIEKEGKFKTFENKFLKWFENYDKYNISTNKKEKIKNIKQAIERNKEEILSQLKNYLKDFEKKKSAIITLKINNNYIGDIDVFKEVLKIKSKEQYYYLSSIGISLARNEICFVCKEKKDEVYGFAIPFKFHTFDKPGFVAGGFNPDDSWKNTPVCYDCAIKLEQGKKYLEENLNFKFYGFRYFLVPKLVMSRDYEDILPILENYKKEVKLTPEIRIQITSDEEEILELIGRQKNFFNNNLFFYEEQQSAFRILLYIEGILPSRLRKLFEIKKKTEDAFAEYNELLNKNQPTLEFNFGVLRNFFPRESKNRDYDKIFLEIVNNIFVGNYVDYNLLMWGIMKQIRKQFIEEQYATNYLSLSAFLLLEYIKNLGLFKNLNLEGGIKNMDDNLKLEEKDFEKKVEDFFNKHSCFFDKAEKRATFLEGILIQLLMNIQYQEKNSTPFRTKLKGLKLDEKIIKKLLPEAQNKLEEYGKNYYRDLESLISRYFILTEGKWSITDDETSFYFVLGMNMTKYFKIKEKEV